MLGLRSRWSFLAVILAAMVAALAAVWLAGSASRLTDYQNRRIFHDLGIITDGLASWPGSVRSMAQSNLMPSRLERVPATDSDGGQARAQFWHPEIGRFAIHYRLAEPGGCDVPGGSDATTAQIVRDDLVVRGQFPLARVLAVDAEAGAERATLKDLVAWLGDNGEGAPLVLPAASDAMVCFWTHLPVDRLIRLDRAAPRISNLLIAEDNQVQLQLAQDRVPISDLTKLPKLASTVATLAATTGVKTPTGSAPADLRDALEPVQTQIAGTEYKVFVRPFRLSADRQAFAVALVPMTAFRSDILQPPPVAIGALTLLVLLLIASTPLIKLRLMGEGESMERLELLGLAVGLFASVALLTNTACFALNVAAQRAAADDRVAATAAALRSQFDREVGVVTRMVARGAIEAGDCRTGLPLAQLFNRGGDPVEPALVGPNPAAPAADPARHPSDAPPVESIFVADIDTGRQLQGSRIVSCRGELDHPSEVGARIDVTNRLYFQWAASGKVGKAGPPHAFGAIGTDQLARPARLFVWPAHSIEPVRSVSDGITKTILAFPAYAGPDARPAAPNAVLSVATILRTFLSPALPLGQSYAVIDLARPGQPVMFHSNPYRANVERFADGPRGRAFERAVDALRVQPDGGDAIALTLDYDGHTQRAAAVRLPGTEWALLVYEQRDAIDRVALLALNWSLIAWSLFGLLTGLALWTLLPLLRRLRRSSGWRLHRIVWPDERRSGQYVHMVRWLAPWLGLLALLAVLLPSLQWMIAFASVAVTVAALVLLARTPPDPINAPLDAETQRRFARALFAVLFGLSILPAVALYRDAAAMVGRQLDFAVQTYETEARDDRTEATLSVARTFYPSLRTRADVPLADSGGGLVAPDWQVRPAGALRPGLIETIVRLWEGERFPRVPAATRGLDRTISPPEDVLRLRAMRPLDVLGVVLVAVFAALLGKAMVDTILSRLFGFGLPIEAMSYPVFPPRPPAGTPMPQAGTLEALGLSAKTMIVDPPLAVRELLLEYGSAVDLSAESLAPVPGGSVAQAKRPIHVFYNLELTLRDPGRRLAALVTLERLLSTEKVRRGEEFVVLLADLTPLERLLQAYERDREELGPIDTDAKRTQLTELMRNREDIRWSRLFEDFQTYIFETLPKVSDRLAYTPQSAFVLRELAPLPEQVIDTLLPPGLKLDPLPLVPGQDRAERIRALDAAYGPRLRWWAFGLKIPSTAAAADFLALMLIEHYQQCWASSSTAERLVLHNLALGRGISMAAINPLSSLIRRGLVVMDPVPRVMNHSFALFVHRAERPARLAEWRAAAPQGSWQATLRPLLVVVLLAVAGLAYAVIDSGQPLSALLLPIAAAAGPALLQAMGVLRKATKT